MKAFGEFVFMVIVAFFHAFVLTKLWGWFIVPFFGIKPLTIAYAIGFTLLVTMFKSVKIDESEDKIVKYVVAVLVPALSLLFGWIVQFFI